MIPKIIHYVWVGEKPLSPLIRFCIDSWKKYCPDYEIRAWGDDALGNISNDYAREAYACRKYAFVSDYLRLYALVSEGGFYFDTDLEITSAIDRFRSYAFVSGYERFGKVNAPITPSFMGAEPNSPIIRDLLLEYEKIHFLSEGGEMDTTTNTMRISRYFERKFALSPPYKSTTTTELQPGIILFPSSHFCTPEKGKENYAIHHFDGSWLPDSYRRYFRQVVFKFWRLKIIKFKKKFGMKVGALPLMEKEKLLYQFSLPSGEILGLVVKRKRPIVPPLYEPSVQGRTNVSGL